MPLVKFTPQPGIVADLTEYAAGSTFYVDSDKVRFRNGFAEKIGGWERDDTVGKLEGEPSKVLAWTTLQNDQCIAIGTSVRLYLIFNGTLHDITPIRATTDPAGNDPFETISGSSSVIVTDNGHGALNNDYVLISNATSFNGVTISGQYQVTTIDSNRYSIDVGTNATASGTGGGATVKLEYLLHYGLASNVDFQGYGEGNHGEGPYGTNEPNDINFLPSTEISVWSLSNFGEDLIATSRNGFTYQWDATSGPTTRATVVTNSPIQSRMSFVSSPDRHLVCLGIYDSTLGKQDMMMVGWSDQENITDWNFADDTNTAGFYRLTLGSRIVTSVQTRNENLIFTDEAVYTMRFTGPPYIFSFNVVGTDISTLGQNSAVDYDGTVFWMGRNNFYMYNGRVQTIPCPIIEKIFNDFNQSESEKVVSGVNKEFNEIWFMYPSATSDINDRYAIYNIQENVWYIGKLNRSSWLDRSNFLAKPIATDSDGYLYYHEKGYNDHDIPLNTYLKMGAFDLDPGDFHMFAHKFIPDASIREGEMKFNIKTKKYPLDSEEFEKGPYTYDGTSRYISFRASGRQMIIEISSDRLDDNWRMGAFRVDLQKDGMR